MSKQQPLSLNQRHTQMLFDLSASNSKPPPEEKTKMEARQRIILNDDVPNFSVFEDSDSSPSPVRFSSNSGGAVLDDQLEIRKGGNGDVLNFSAIADFSPDSSTSSPIVDFEEKQTNQSECSEDYLAPLDLSSAGSVEKEIDQANSGTEVPWAEEEVSYSSKYSEDRLAPLCSGIVEKEINQPKSRTEVPWEEEDPLFSRIDDSSSSRSVEMEPSKGMPENCELSDKGQNDYEKTSNWSTTMYSTSNLPGEKEKTMKVKIKGRRRLCKISKEDNNGSDDMNLIDNEESKLFELADFDSPPQAKKAILSEKGGGNEIRDILNNLSSRFEILSIERNRPPKHSDLTKEEEFPDYQSAGSTFSLSSGSSSDSTKESRKGGALPEEFLKENDFDRESESGCVIGKLNGIRAFGGAPKRSEVKQVVGKSQPMKNSFSSNNVVEEVDCNDSDSDCVIVGDKNAVNQVGRNNRKSRPDPKYSDDVDASDFVSDEEHTFTLSGPKFTYKLPGKIAKMLYPHQRDGLKWLWSLHCLGKGGILGDDMGLGKTMQICGFLAGLFKSKLIARVMIVAPKTLLPHWIKELSVVGLSEKIREYFATSPKIRDYELQYVLQDKGILLTTYDIVRNNVKSLCGDGYHLDRDEEMTWDYMILDEGHLIKNPSTQRAKSLHEIPCAHRIIISGTPIQNNLKELWALFNFCCPGLLGDKKWFKEKYEQLILRGNDKNASDRDKRIGSAIAKELREHIQPYFLRRLKSEVFSDDASTSAKLSKKNEIIVWLKLTNCQRQLYEAFLKSEIVLSACDSSPLAALTILKKICDHPLLLTKRAAEEVLEGMDSTSNQEDHVVAERLVMQMANVTEKHDLEDMHDVSCKMAFILALLDNLIPSGHRVLIFSQTRKMLNLIQDSLISNGFQLMRIDGTTKAADRLKIVNDYQEGHGAPIFLLTSQVGGLGLTLTKADRVIVVDPAWNPSTDNQSVDRAYRIGQTKDVVVYRLMTCGTVEEKIYRKQVYKGGLFKTATEHKEQIRYFSQQDLRELFSLPKDGGFDISLTQQQLNEEHDHEHKMEEVLKDHVHFLETLGIAGVSQHSLLFSKTAPVSAVQDEDEVRIARGMISGDSSTSYTSAERVVDASQYAFKPKDVKLPEKYVPIKSGPTEADIRDRIRRLTQILANTATISKLPDKGEKIRRQISDLHKELDDIRMEKEKKNEVIDLDDLSGRFHRVVNV